MMFDEEPEWPPRWRFKHLKRHLAFVPKGFIRHYVLRLLSEKPMSGSEIIQSIEEKSEGRWRPSPGSVYPLLAWLQEKGYIKETPTQEPGIKRYALTEEGKKFLEEHEKGRAKMEEHYRTFGMGLFFDPHWLIMRSEHVKGLIKASLELQKALWSLRRVTSEEEAKEKIAKATEIVKEATEKIEKLIKEDRK
jgi:DNA-binding PadR family transcriptional regulator